MHKTHQEEGKDKLELDDVKYTKNRKMEGFREENAKQSNWLSLDSLT